MKMNYILLASSEAFGALYYETKHELLYRTQIQTRDDEGKLLPQLVQVTICFVALGCYAATERPTITNTIALAGIWAAVLYIERYIWNVKTKNRLSKYDPVKLSQLTQEEREKLLWSAKWGHLTLYPRTDAICSPIAALVIIALTIPIAFLFSESGSYNLAAHYISFDEAMRFLVVMILLLEESVFFNSFTSQKRRRRIYQKLKIDAETIENSEDEIRR